VIAISAYEEQPTEHAAVEAGARAFLPKPIEHERLLETIRQVLGET
jgi:CheY-like chemotaxis protein